VPLTTPEQWNVRLAGSIDEAKELQLPLPNLELHPAKGEKSHDGVDQ